MKKPFINSSVLLLVLAILLPIVIPVLFYFLNLIPKNDFSSILSYLGGVICGWLTFAGVHYTIKYQDRLRKEDIAIQYKPLFNIELDLSKINLSIQEDRININNAIASNVGRGEIYDFQIDILKSNKQFKYEAISHNFISKDVLANGKNIQFSFSIDLDREEIKKVQKHEYVYLGIQFSITGKDLLRNEIKQQINHHYLYKYTNKKDVVKKCGKLI